MDVLFAPGTAAPWISAALAVLIGLLFGAERETARTNVHVGLRDFVAISVIAHVCSIIAIPWVTVAVVIALAGVIVVHHMREDFAAGVTTEIALVATFVLAYLVSLPHEAVLRQVALALAVLLVLLLDAKPSVKRFFRETVTETEVADTIKFLALVFVIYPLLPDGRYGPFEAFAPRSLWMAVVLVSAISFIGYFLEKFLGARSGLRAAAIIGGLASTTAATQAFAQRAKAQPERAREYARAAAISNAVQYGRVVALLAIVWPDLAWMIMLPFGGAAIVGLVIGMWPTATRDADVPVVDIGNPLRIAPAIKFAAFLGVVSLGSKWAMYAYGGGAFVWTSALAGLVDVDAVVLSAGDRHIAVQLPTIVIAWSIVAAMAANVIVKSVIAATSATAQFSRLVIVGMTAMIVVCATILLVMG
ncbi:MAG: DUF4010 domain-containing protein [Candidatus Kapabacteria bacterium]|nr:DUF4010 domain-containing protein [Candidatus Kapabacteria bacterium]